MAVRPKRQIHATRNTHLKYSTCSTHKCYLIFIFFIIFFMSSNLEVDMGVIACHCKRTANVIAGNCT